MPAGDYYCGLRGFQLPPRTHPGELHLNATGMEFASEFVVRAALASYSIDEVPTTCTLKPDGRSRARRTCAPGATAGIPLRFLLLYQPELAVPVPGAGC